MKLVNYGAGEVSDRLTILSLKQLFGAEAGKEITHFRDEQAALLVQLRGRTLNGKWFEAVLELAAVNAALWHAEDDLREHRGGMAARTAAQTLEDVPRLLAVGTLAFRIQALNDRRAELIGKINSDAGDSVTQEKVIAATVRETAPGGTP